MKRGQEPAYPFVSHGGVHEHQACEPGMSTRLRIASEQMAGMWCTQGDTSIKGLAHDALMAADALIAAEEESR